MSWDAKSDEILFHYMDTGKKMFEKLELKLCVQTICEIEDFIKNMRPSIDSTKLNLKFCYLQDAVDVEFSKKSNHHKDL